MRPRRFLPCFLLALPLAACASGGSRVASAPPSAAPVKTPAKAAAPPVTVAAVVERLGGAVDGRLAPLFARAQVAYPPRVVHLLAFKEERKIELWAEAGGAPAFVRSYRVLRASGKAGPKMEEGDWQVPEGLYRVTWLNPRSGYHLSLKLDYPNAYDRIKARLEERRDLGGDIFIHGSDVSAGCLAVGDEAVEELFVLAARVGASNMRVLIAPNDLRREEPPADTKYRPAWLPELYAQIRAELGRFRCC
jgi:hypothetical protein